MLEIDMELLGGRWGNPVVKELKGGKSIPVYCGCRCVGGEGGGNILNGPCCCKEDEVSCCRVRTGETEAESCLGSGAGMAEDADEVD